MALIWIQLRWKKEERRRVSYVVISNRVLPFEVVPIEAKVLQMYNNLWVVRDTWIWL
jgi:hypothetical protein